MFRIVLIVVFFNISSCLWAQSATTGGLRGSVVDPMGGAVLGVTVTLVNPTTGQTQTTLTDANGLYGFALLSPGTYDVDFSMPGFKTSSAESVVVNVSEAPNLDAQLEIGASEDRVPCQCQLSEGAASASGTVVDSKTITAVPLTTRNLTQVLSMSRARSTHAQAYIKRFYATLIQGPPRLKFLSSWAVLDLILIALNSLLTWLLASDRRSSMIAVADCV